MMIRISKDKVRKYKEKQKQILSLLLEHPFQQKELATEMGISGAGLLYHLNKLEDDGIIRKITTAQVGNVSINEISLNPNAIQQVRAILGKKTRKYTLITGFGIGNLKTEYYSSNIPVQAKNLLEDEGYQLSRIIALITEDSNLNRAQKLVKIDEVLKASYEDYRNIRSTFMTRDLEFMIQKEQKQNDLIIDLTPISKLLTLKLLEISHQYSIPSFYMGMNEKKEYNLIWVNYT